MFTAVVVRVWLWVNDAAAFDESQCVGLVSVGSARMRMGVSCVEASYESLSLSLSQHATAEHASV